MASIEDPDGRAQFIADLDQIRMLPPHDAAEDRAESGGARKYYSVSVRLRRITIEDAFVLVPVDERVVSEVDDSRRLDGAKVMEQAVALGAVATDWQIESQELTPHPIQRRRPDDRRADVMWDFDDEDRSPGERA